MRDLIPQKPAGRKPLSTRSAKPLLRRNHSCSVGCPRDPIPPKWVSDRAFLALSQAKACTPARRLSHIHPSARPWRLQALARALRARSPPFAQPAARLRALVLARALPFAPRALAPKLPLPPLTIAIPAIEYEHLHSVSPQKRSGSPGRRRAPPAERKQGVDGVSGESRQRVPKGQGAWGGRRASRAAAVPQALKLSGQRTE